jgi:hypothetical protein
MIEFLIKLKNRITKMNNKQQLLQSIKQTENQLNKLKEELNNHKTPTIQEARVGDTLEDGSIVLKKENGIALLVAPKRTEVQCSWSKEFSEVFDKLQEEGFNPSQWFVPTVQQLQLAYEVMPEEFRSTYYWSSSEINASIACNVYFCSGSQNCFYKSNPYCVRSVRCVVF